MSLCVFLIIDWVIMPIYIRKDKTVRLIDVKNKLLETGTSNLIFAKNKKLYSPVSGFYKGTYYEVK